jgi:glycosyltransferase involved in cell wall biosynthesis
VKKNSLKIKIEKENNKINIIFSSSFKDLVLSKLYRYRVFCIEKNTKEIIYDPAFIISKPIVDFKNTHKEINFKISFYIDEIIDVKSITLGVVEEYVRWYDQYFIKINDFINDKDLENFINKKYNKILKRNADKNGINNFLHLIKSGKLLADDLEGSLINSDEFFKKNYKYEESSKKNICIEGGYGTYTGYAIAAETIGMGLSDSCNLSFFPRFDHRDHVAKEKNFLDLCLNKNIDTDINLIILPLYHDVINGGPISSKPPLRLSKSKKVIFTMFEADLFPRAWHERVKNFDAIIFPCLYNLNIFKEQNNLIPSYCSPIGVRTDLFEKKERFFPKNRKFKFLTYLSGHDINDDRKNFPLVIYSFIKCFKNNKNVELIVKTNIDSNKINIIGQIPDNIKFINDNFTRIGMVNLLNNCDCFIFPSKGEGYGLPPREAMATSMPTIISDFSALSDIADDNISFSIKTDKRSVAIFDKNTANEHNLGNMIFGKWINPSQDDLIEKMLFVYNNYEHAIQIGKNAAEYIHKYENYEICGKNLYNILMEIK